MGYGHIENCKGKAAAFDKAKKEGTTDALKRALRNFGNVLGNCVYDKNYIKEVTKLRAPQVSLTLYSYLGYLLIVTRHGSTHRIFIGTLISPEVRPIRHQKIQLRWSDQKMLSRTQLS